MNVSDIIDGIIARKKELNMTVQQLADASGVPKSTVDRVLKKTTDNPTTQVVLDLAEAVGYIFGEETREPLAPAVENTGEASAYLQHIISMYERQLATQAEAHARELDKQERQYNTVTAEKNRWIKILAIIVGILGIGVVSILLIDILNPTVGWFRRELSYYSGTGMQNMLAVILDWFGL